MKEKPAIAHQKIVVDDFYDWLSRFAFGPGLFFIGAITLQPMVYQTSLK